MATRFARVPSSFIALLVCMLLTACFGPSSSSNNPAQGKMPGSIAVTPATVTQPVPPTQTDCPTNGVARPMVTAPLATGDHPQIIYIPADTNSDSLDQSRKRVVRYDTITNTSTDIVTLAEGEGIKELLLSADRQWLLLRMSYNDGSPVAEDQLRAVRVDGQGMQTLFCQRIGSLTWSPDRRWIGFTQPIQSTGSADQLNLIDMATGKITVALDISQAKSAVDARNPIPTVWLTNTHLYLTDSVRSKTPQTYLLDVTKGQKQRLNDLSVVTQQAYRNAATNGIDLFFDAYQCEGERISCSNSDISTSKLLRLPVGSDTTNTVFKEDKTVINGFTLINQQTLLIFADNKAEKKREIWSVSTNGSQKTRIVSAAASPMILDQTGLYLQSLTPWSVVSPDGKQFIVSAWPTSSGENVQFGLGSLNGQITPLPGGSRNALVVGWTML